MDLNLLPVEKPDIKGLYPGQLFLHVGQPRDYDCLIQRLSVWSGFMAMWAEIATPEQAKEIVRIHFMILAPLTLRRESVLCLLWKNV